MTVQAPEPTGDDVPDGTQIPTESGDEVVEDGEDAGVNDTGTEEWYGHTVPKGEI